MDRLIGEQIGNYLILDELGRGGMARVYRARQINLDRECALKLLRPELAEDESFIDRFLREARAVARLDHPNIVPVYDTGRLGPYHFLAMKYLDGLTLARMLQAGKLELRSVAAYVGQASAALEYAHGQGVVHRDVKPGNMIIDDRGWLTITDFGLARLSQEMRMTMTGTLLGTPAYMAPEQVSGDTVTPQTDIYQLGVVTYEMLTGTTPFRDRPQHAMLLAHLQETPDPVTEHNENLTPEIDAVIQRALAKAPSDRYQTVSEFAGDLINAIFAVLPQEEQGGRIGPYEVSRLPETVSWTDVNITPSRISTDQLDREAIESGSTVASPAPTSAAEPASEEIRRAEQTTNRTPGAGEIVATIGAAGAPPADTPPASTPAAGAASGGSSMRYLVAGGALIAVLAVFSLASFQFGLFGGDDSDDDPTPTPTEVEAAVADETPTEALSTPTATTPIVVPDPATATPTSSPTPEPTATVAPTSTLVPTPIVIPTRTPIIIHTPTPNPEPPTATVPAGDVPVEGAVIFETDFSNWGTGPLENGETFFANGTYHMLENVGGGYWIYAYSFSDGDPFTDFSVSVDLRRINAEDIADACVLARIDSINQDYHYALCIDGAGGIWAYYQQFNEAGEIVRETLLPYGEVTAAPPDNWTTPKIVVRGETLWFFMNGELVGTAQHTGPPGGEVGMILNNYGESPAEYEFTNMVVRALE